MERTKRLQLLLGTIRWVARILGTFLAGLVLVFVVAHALGEEGLPNPFTQPLGVALEFVGLFAAVLGAVIAWKWEGLGGVMVLGGMMIFHVVERDIWLAWGELFDLTGVLFLVYWYFKRFRVK